MWRKFFSVSSFSTAWCNSGAFMSLPSFNERDNPPTKSTSISQAATTNGHKEITLLTSNTRFSPSLLIPAFVLYCNDRVPSTPCWSLRNCSHFYNGVYILWSLWFAFAVWFQKFDLKPVGSVCILYHRSQDDSFLGFLFRMRVRFARPTAKKWECGRKQRGA